MEPMTLGSPGSPSAGGPAGSTAGGNFLPSFLMGDTNIPSTPRSNTLSPTRGRTQLAFGNSPAGRVGAASPSDFNRSALLQQRSLFGANQPLTPQHGHQQHHHQQQQQQLNASLSGPPTMGLFDSLKAAENGPATGAPFGTSRPGPGAPGAASAAAAANFSFNQSYGAFNDSLNTDAYLTQTSDFNVSRLTSPVLGAGPGDFRTPSVVSPRQPTAAFWVTVFGFPPASINAILAHFAQCGSIVDKVLPPNGGNWLHLKYASRVECDKAVNFNERIINNSIMIGVVYCRDADIVDKENQNAGFADANRSLAGNTVSANRVRPLAQSAYHSSLNPNEVLLSPPMPKRSTGLVNKAMDMIFGW